MCGLVPAGLFRLKASRDNNVSVEVVNDPAGKSGAVSRSIPLMPDLRNAPLSERADDARSQRCEIGNDHIVVRSL